MSELEEVDKTLPDGSKYSGSFKDGKMHGQGTKTYPDGSKYVGEWKDGKRHGQGRFTYADGSAYIGEFIAGKEQGSGECISKDGSTVSCFVKEHGLPHSKHLVPFGLDLFIEYA